MKLRKCRGCGAKVVKTAKTCPHCGLKDPGLSMLDQLMGWLILLVMFFGVWAGYVLYKGGL